MRAIGNLFCKCMRQKARFEGLSSHRMVEQGPRSIIKDHKYICNVLISQRQGLGYDTVDVTVEIVIRFMLRNDEKAEASEIFEVQ